MAAAPFSRKQKTLKVVKSKKDKTRGSIKMNKNSPNVIPEKNPSFHLIYDLQAIVKCCSRNKRTCFIHLKDRKAFAKHLRWPEEGTQSSGVSLCCARIQISLRSKLNLVLSYALISIQKYIGK